MCIRDSGMDRLSGIRYVHTHLKGEPLSEDDLTDLILLRFDWIVAVEAKADGLPGKVFQAHLLPANETDVPWEILPTTTVYDLPEDYMAHVEALEAEFQRTRKPLREGDNTSRAILVHVSQQPMNEIDESVAELKELCRSAGIEVLAEIVQRRECDPKLVVGRGKLRSILIKAMQVGAETLVFDVNLTPSQVKALADFTDIKILDLSLIHI